jgi:hypothetical protein
MGILLQDSHLPATEAAMRLKTIRFAVGALLLAIIITAVVSIRARHAADAESARILDLLASDGDPDRAEEELGEPTFIQVRGNSPHVCWVRGHRTYLAVWNGGPKYRRAFVERTPPTTPFDKALDLVGLW